jgi:DNA-binding transcriptional ArsR family regulator
MAVDHVRDADKVFKALADPTRRTLLDLLCEDNGQTWASCASTWTWPGNRSPSTWACWKTPT